MTRVRSRILRKLPLSLSSPYHTEHLMAEDLGASPGLAIELKSTDVDGKLDTYWGGNTHSRCFMNVQRLIQRY